MYLMPKLAVRITALLLTTGLLFFSACRSAESDYREPYLGPWHFYTERTEINTDSIGYYFHDAGNYEGAIDYGESENDIRIQYTAENAITLTLEADGTLSEFPTQYCSGTFDTPDSLRLFLRWGGLGGGTTHQIDGWR